MSARTVQAAIWFALWILLTTGTRNYHPSLPVAATATAFLELASAFAIYLNQLVLVPTLLKRRKILAYVTALSLSLTMITLGVVVLIQLMYDVLVGPDPRRFGFWTNMEYDFSWVATHLIVGACAIGLWRFWAEPRRPIA